MRPLAVRASLRPAHHHVNLAAAASRTDEPPAPIDNRRFGTVSSSHLGRIGLKTNICHKGRVPRLGLTTRIGGLLSPIKSAGFGWCLY
jgi:hypothetical protein